MEYKYRAMEITSAEVSSSLPNSAGSHRFVCRKATAIAEILVVSRIGIYEIDAVRALRLKLKVYFFGECLFEKSFSRSSTSSIRALSTSLAIEASKFCLSWPFSRVSGLQDGLTVGGMAM